MLPILRTISVGGVLLAMMLLLLARDPPSQMHAPFPRLAAPARGPLIDRRAHPEWRQLLLLAAFHRAEELQMLRALPDTPVHAHAAAKPAPKPVPDKQVAALPAGNAGSAPAVTGSVANTADDASIPVDIGEASSTELPLAPHAESPPVISAPQALDSGEQPATPKTTPQATPAARDTPPVSVLTPHRRQVPPRARPSHRTSRIRHARRTKKHAKKYAKASTQPAAPEQVDLFKLLFAPAQPTDTPAAKSGGRQAARD